MNRKSRFLLRASAGAALLGAFVLAGLLTAPTFAANGPDFTGFFQITAASDLGEEVQLTLSARIFNGSGSAVTGATVTLEDPLEPGKVIGSFAGLVDIKEDESARVSDSFTVPHRDHDRWQQGVAPRLEIEFVDAQGRTVRRPVELMPIPAE